MSRPARKRRRQEISSARKPNPPTPRRRWVWGAVTGLVVVLGGLVFWVSGLATGHRSTASPPEVVGVRRESGLDVLLITLDTLRADALGSYGNERAATPWMDRLAEAGVRFDNAHAHNVTTLPSHANILSGLYPLRHGVRDNSGFRFPNELATLASILKHRGYRTGAFISAFPLDSRFGLGQGFDVYEDSFVGATIRTAFLEQERPGTETVALARRWLATQSEQPFFCWLHLYEPHFPWVPPEPFSSRFSDAPYHGDVAAADAALAPLLEPILAAGDTAKALVVLTSDHGEALGEHGEATHGIFAYEATLRVPLILYQPRLFGPRVVQGPARHVDILPTILDALSLAVPEGLDGRSLLPAAAGEPDDETPASYFEALSGQLNRGWAPLYGVIHGDSKYIDLPIAELYRLRDDPREEMNLAAAEPRHLATLREILEPLRALDRGSAPSPESAEVRERLQSLGYLSGNAPPAKQSYTGEDDPKRLIELDAIQREIAGLYAAGDLTGALRRCRELVRSHPGMRIALLDLAHLERESGNFEAAVKALEQAFILNPEDATVLALLSAYLTQAGRADEAVAVTEPHTRLAQPDIDVLLMRGLALARLGRPQDARATFQKARQVDPEHPMVPVHEGTLYLMQGQRDKARAAYEEALVLNPNVVRAQTALGILAAEDGRVEEALVHWRSAIDSDPREYAKLLAVGTGFWNAGRRTEARPLLELFVDSAPRSSYGEEIVRISSLLAETK